MMKGIKKIAVLVEMEDGTAHQVLSTHEQKLLFIKLLANKDGEVIISKPIVPFEITEIK